MKTFNPCLNCGRNLPDCHGPLECAAFIAANTLPSQESTARMAYLQAKAKLTAARHAVLDAVQAGSLSPNAQALRDVNSAQDWLTRGLEAFVIGDHGAALSWFTTCRMACRAVLGEVD